VQEWYEPPLSPCQIWWSWDIARRQGAKNFCFYFFVCLSVTLKNNKVCERHFAINALELGNDLGRLSLDREMFVDVHLRSTLSLQLQGGAITEQRS